MSGTGLSVIAPTPTERTAPAPAAPQQLHDQPQQEQLPASQPVLDIDDRALAELRRLAEIEEQAASGKQQTDEPPAPPTPLADAHPAPQPGKVAPAGGPMIPKARFDQALADKEAWKARALFMEAQAARQAQRAATPSQPAQPAPAPGPTPKQVIEQQIQAANARSMAAAERFDRGEITAVELERERIQIAAEVASLREQHLYQSILAAIPQPQLGLTDEAYIDEATARLEAEHPWLAKCGPAETQFLEQIARAEAVRLGKPISDPCSPSDLLRLRTRVAELSSQFCPSWWPGEQPPAAPAHPQPAAPAPVQPAARRGAPQQPAQPQSPAFVRRAGTHPPDLNRAGTAEPPDTMSEERVLSMTTDEIAALPAAVRARLLSG